MCLGDARLMRFVTNKITSVTTTTTYAKLLERNVNRVGLLLPAATNIVQYWFMGAQPTATIGLLFGTSGSQCIHYFTWIMHGPLVQEELWGREATAGQTFNIIEQEVPNWVMDQLMSTPLGGKWQDGQDPFLLR